jgi:uncharacterized protein
VSKLRIAPGLELDADYMGGGTFALLAKKGAGKTYQGRVISEELWKAKVPFVALDPMDAWWGLRAAADGKGEGIPVAIFGGPHGDAPLERTSGKLMADLVIDEELSMVLSLKHFGSRAAERQFALDFLERLYRRNSELVHLLIDEADLFAPQKPQAGDQPLLGVTENIVRRGRNSGIGITLITQRPAVLNKDVLTQVDGLCVMRMLGPQDRNAIDDWVGEHGDTNLGKEVKGSLPDLATGECWWWVPELGVLKKVTVREARTFDSSPTRKRGSKGRDPKSFADVDMDAIEVKMADTIERAKAEDPKELNRRIRELEKQLRERPAETKVETVTETVDVSVLEEDDREVLVNTVRDFLGGLEELVQFVGHMREAVAPVLSSLERIDKAAAGAGRTERAATAVQRGPKRPAAEAVRRAPARRPAPAAEDDGDFSPTGAQQKILDALAWFEEIGLAPVTRLQAAMVAGYHPRTKGFTNGLGALHTGGRVHYPTPGMVELTEVGRAEANPPASAGSAEQLQEMIFAQVGPARTEILRELLDVYPGSISREELAARVGKHERTKGFTNGLGSLRSLGLIDYPQPGFVEALPILVLEGAAA